MKLSDFNKKADDYTSKASDIIRQLILGGIAIIWLFRITINGTTTLDSFLIWPLTALCVAFLFDLLQYVSGGFIWKRFFKQKEKEVKHKQSEQKSHVIDDNVSAPRKLNRPIYIFYWAKITIATIAYILLIIFLIHKISFQ
jgi:hypothetical protein